MHQLGNTLKTRLEALKFFSKNEIENLLRGSEVFTEEFKTMCSYRLQGDKILITEKQKSTKVFSL
jgi:hypothetical protein